MYIVLFTLGILHLSGAIDDICDITEHPTSKNVPEADSVTLTCLTGNDGEVVDWLFGPNSESVDRSKYRFGRGQLVIDSFDPSYAGTYRCVVEMKGLGSCVSKAATLKYYDTSGFQVDPQDFVIYSADNLAVFNCTYRETDYSVVPDIEWEYPSWLPDRSVTIFQYRYTSFLQISNATMYDSISLRCVVKLPGPQSQNVESESATLFVPNDAPPNNLPSFTSVPLETMYLNKGDTLIAGCSQRSPTVSIPIAWAFKNGTEIWLRSIGFTVFPESEIPVSIVGDFNLLINSTLYDFHNITLQCHFHETDGLLINPVTFFVYDTPIINNNVEPEGIEIIKHKEENATIEIIVSKSTPATVQWFHNGERLTSGDGGHTVIANEDAPEFDSTVVWTEDRNASLTLLNITCGDGGLYQVEISNSFAAILFTYHLIVDGCQNTGSAIQPGDGDDSFPWWIILIIILLLILLILLILLCLWCWRRRYVTYEAEKLEQKYHKEYEAMRGSPIDSTV